MFRVLDFFPAGLFRDTKDVFGRTEKWRASGREMVEQHLTLTVKTDSVTVAFPLKLLQCNRNPSLVGFGYYLTAIQ